MKGTWLAFRDVRVESPLDSIVVFLGFLSRSCKNIIPVVLLLNSQLNVGGSQNTPHNTKTTTYDTKTVQYEINTTRLVSWNRDQNLDFSVKHG